MTAIGFVGLGAMGGRMADRLLAAGREVYGNNRTASKAAGLVERGLRWRDTPREVACHVAIRERQPDRKDWRIGDARRALADFERRVALEPHQRRRLQEATRARATSQTQSAANRAIGRSVASYASGSSIQGP